MSRCSVLVLVSFVLCLPAQADAFCGFYVAGADQELFADATMVVMMREGRRTVLSMQNDYAGPPEDFAMVIPVPTVLQAENVKTLPHDVFDDVQRLSAPRLVEYWEQNPCARPRPRRRSRFAPMSAAMSTGDIDSLLGGAVGVSVEAEFAVGEYEIVILSARDSGGLEQWLHANGYNVPEGASAVLRPYVEQGMKFFVAASARRCGQSTQRLNSDGR